MNKIIIQITIALLLLTACSTEQTNEIKVGYIGPLTGDGAALGLENLKGMELAVEAHNTQSNIKIKLIAKDDQFNEKEALTQYKQLVDIEGVDYILSSVYGSYMTLSSFAETDNVILISSLDSSEEMANLNKNSFSIGIYDESIGIAIADYLNEKEVKETGIIMNLEDPFMTFTQETILQKFEGKSETQNFDFSTNDFKTILEKFRKYDHIVLLGLEETGLIVKQARKLGMENKLIGIDTMSSEDFRENTGGRTEGLVFTFWEGSQNNTVYKEMLVNYEAKYGKQPDNVLFTSVGYDSMKVLASAIEKCGNDVDCTREKIESTKNFLGSTGRITIDKDHITRSIEESMYTYRNGEIIQI